MKSILWGAVIIAIGLVRGDSVFRTLICERRSSPLVRGASREARFHHEETPDV